MKKTLVIIAILTLVTVFGIVADDGSWNNSFSVQGGSIYSETDHPDITLEKELLVFDGEKTTAVFLFRNTSRRAVTADCGFPVRHKIDTVDYGDHLEIPAGSYGGDVIHALSWFETVQLYDPADLDGPPDCLDAGILLNDFNNSREFIDPAEAPAEVEFTIYQDGKAVEVGEVLLERQASRLGAAVTYHFKHSLRFTPGQESVVRVEYSQNLVTGSDGMSDAFSWDYVIGTGATWKGPIGSFLMLMPSDWLVDELPGLSEFGDYGGFRVYGATGYEPARIDTFKLYRWGIDYMSRYIYQEDTFPPLKKMWQTGSREVMQEVEPVQDFVRAVLASSFLTDRLNVFNSEGVVDRAGFDPAAAFDGLGETSWCEAVSGDGIGEYLECTLKEPVWGLTIKNGFTRFPAEDWMFENEAFNEYIRDDALGLKDYYSMNNRVKTLEITTPDGEPGYTLELKDRRDPQTFAGVFLEPGTWRFTIRSVYPGTKWKDTCLAEITFVPRPASQRLSAFLNDPFFTEHMNGYRF